MNNERVSRELMRVAKPEKHSAAWYVYHSAENIIDNGPSGYDSDDFETWKDFVESAKGTALGWAEGCDDLPQDKCWKLQDDIEKVKPTARFLAEIKPQYKEMIDRIRQRESTGVKMYWHKRANRGEEMNNERVARELVKLAKALVGANEKGLITTLESLGFEDWEYQNRNGLKGIALSQRLYKGLINKYRSKFPKLAKKYGYVYMPNVAFAFFVTERDLDKMKRRTVDHRGLEIVAPIQEGVEPWLIPELGNAEFMSLAKAKGAIEEMYKQYEKDEEDNPGEYIGSFSDWLMEFE